MKPIAAGAEERDGMLHNDDAAMLRAAGNVTCRSTSPRPSCCANPAHRTSPPRWKA
jgi:dethiobiotin synthetase